MIFVTFNPKTGDILSLSSEPSVVVEERLFRGEPILVIERQIDPNRYVVDLTTMTLVTATPARGALKF